MEDAVALVPLLAVLVIAGAIALVLAVTHRSPRSREATVSAARQHARLAATAAPTLGAAAALLVAVSGTGSAEPGSLGVTALLVPAVFAVVHTVVLAVGELSWPRPRAEVRRARLVRRGLLDSAPPWLVRTAAGTTALAVGVLGLGALLADETGRRLTHASLAGGTSWSSTSPVLGPTPGWLSFPGQSSYAETADGMSVSTASPFPGLFYGRPAAIGLAALAVVTLAALWVVANRPAVATSDERVETALRRASAHRVLRTAVGCALVVTGGLMAVGGMAMANVDLLPVSGLPGAVPGLLTAATGLVVACVRAPGVPADEPAPV